ncbi:hypothetical protein HPP92_004728 [Vanilla planifolia]|uniref:Uncharacterized protein n=1 Tax=Vanilla planifolia TaxID=51239 RepID=A0A835RFG6_VANPL|nr:hypothetical protein HPP92_004728 [Vanilla planifolia]
MRVELAGGRQSVLGYAWWHGMDRVDLIFKGGQAWVNRVDHESLWEDVVVVYLGGSYEFEVIEFCDMFGIGALQHKLLSSYKGHEDLAGELVKMFTRELSLKRFLVMDLLFSTSMEDGRQEGIFSWSDELYTGEFNDLRSTGMLVHDGFYLSPPQIMDWQSSDPSNREPLISPSHEVLQVYLTTWLADLNIEMHRVSEIFSVVGDAIGVKLA